MPSSFRRLGPLLVLALAGLAALQQTEEPALPLSGAQPSGELAFEIRAAGGAGIPARLTFVPPDRSTPDLFPVADAAPHEIAARRNVVYSRSGKGLIRVPVGRYTVYASRGLEWSLASQELEIASGERVTWRAELRHEVDTAGWISGDFHLHTLTYSGHGDANLEERVLSFLGEGLEFAVATDHDHLTDYGPTLRALGVQDELTAVTGDEVTTPIGHFNAFPLDPARPPVDSSLRDENRLFALLRLERNPQGVVPVIQLNHPRWGEIDCFGKTGLDPVDGGGTSPSYSRDFDSIEVLNENVGWGYFDPVVDRRDTGANLHSVLADWFHLLDRGERHAAVGNSDSHHVQSTFAGWPRNFVRCASEPGRIDAGEVAAAIRTKQVFTTLGPFVEYSVEGVPMGGEARARDGHAELELRVQAASWIACDRVEVIVNGELYATLPVAESSAPLRLERTLELCLRSRCAEHDRTGSPGKARDAWVALLVEGDRNLFPVLNDAAQPALPLCIANPVWIDGDGDGAWTSPLARVGAELAAEGTPDEARAWFGALSPAEQVLALGAVPRGPFAGALLMRAFASTDRRVRLAAARAAERCGVGGDSGPLQRAWGEVGDDPYYAALLLRALVAERPEQGSAGLMALAKRFGDATVRRYSDDLLPVLAGAETGRWLALGPFDPSSPEFAREDRAPPEPDPLRGKAGRELRWQALEAGENGFFDLSTLAASGESSDQSLCFLQTWLRVSAPKQVVACFGSDDGSRLWLNDALVYENPEARRADPFEKILLLDLQPGWNRILLQVENESGGYGFYFHLLERGVEVATSSG